MKVGLESFTTSPIRLNLSKKCRLKDSSSLWKTDSISTAFWQHKRDYCRSLKSHPAPRITNNLHFPNQYIPYAHFLENINCIYLDLTNTLF